MQDQVRNFLTILNSILHNMEDGCPSENGLPAQSGKRDFCLEPPVDFGEIMKLAREHNLSALVGDALCACPEFTASEQYQSAVSETIGAVTSQTIRTAEFLQIYQKLTDAGLKPIVMKGIICRELFGEKRDYRPSADEDILIRREDFEAVSKVMEAGGFRAERDDVTARQLEELQEVTFNDAAGRLHIEVHTNVIGHEDSLRATMNDYFLNVFDDPLTVEVDKVTLYTMNHTDHFLFLVLHMFKHILLSGCGIRQILDILLYYRRYGDEIDWEYVNRCLRESEADRFFSDIIFLGNKYLGFHLDAPCEPLCPEDLLDDMVRNGAFGNGTQMQRTAASMTSAAIRNRDKKSGMRTFVRTLFPERERMAAAHPELLEKPWLQPVFWVKRWIRFLRHNRENGGNLAADSIAVSRRRMALLRKYRIL